MSWPCVTRCSHLVLTSQVYHLILIQYIPVHKNTIEKQWKTAKPCAYFLVHTKSQIPTNIYIVSVTHNYNDDLYKLFIRDNPLITLILACCSSVVVVLWESYLRPGNACLVYSLGMLTWFMMSARLFTWDNKSTLPVISLFSRRAAATSLLYTHTVSKSPVCAHTYTHRRCLCTICWSVYKITACEGRDLTNHARLTRSTWTTLSSYLDAPPPVTGLQDFLWILTILWVIILKQGSLS